MLSIQKLSSAAQASSYYQADNYYLAGTSGRGQDSRWFGAGAAAAGINGPVDSSSFEAILNGRVPGGPALGSMIGGKLQHAPGIDLTFSAPKSVSLMAEVFGHEKIRDAHIAAVDATMAWLQANLAETRIFDAAAGRQVITGNQAIVAALFDHQVNRNLDPQLHTHAVLANMVIGSEGKWRSMVNDKIYDNKMLLGAFYRGELAGNLRGLGYQIEQTHSDGRFEIAGFPRDLIDEFSTRTKQINEAVLAIGADTPKIRDLAALGTRASKTAVDLRQLKDAWSEKAQSLGYDQHTVNALVLKHQSQSEIAPQIALSQALQEITERSSVFRPRDVLRTAIAASLGQTRPISLSDELKAKVARGELLNSENPKLSEFLTTPTMVELERSTIALMRTGQHAVDRLIGIKDAAQLVHHSTLNEGQRASITHIVTSSDRVIGVQGLAGTGKSTMMAALRQMTSERGIRILGLAPSASATQTLKESIGSNAQTLQNFLTRHESVLRGTAGHTQTKKAASDLRSTVVIVDEASMISGRQMRDLLTLGELLGIPKIVLAGDKNQLSAVEAGKPFGQLQGAAMSTSHMNEIVRQKTMEHREAVEHAATGDIQLAFTKLGSNVIEVGSGSLSAAAAEIWLNQTQSGRDNTLIVATNHKLRREINNSIREKLQAEGKLGGSSIEISALAPRSVTSAELNRTSTYHVGEVVLFNRDYRSLNISKGTRAEITSVSSESGMVTLNVSGKPIKWMPSRTAGNTPGAVEIFDKFNLNLAAGDKISWTRNDSSKRFLKSQVVTVLSISTAQVRVRDEAGKTHSLGVDDSQLRHIDYAWASTAYRAQGETVDRVIGVLESRGSDLTNQKNFYVQISRSRLGAQLITDDIKQLKSTLERQTGEPVAALEIRANPPPIETTDAELKVVAAREPSPELTQKIPAVQKEIEPLESPTREYELDFGR